MGQALGHVRHETCLKLRFPRASGSECRRLHAALASPTLEPLDPCAELNATAPVARANSPKDSWSDSEDTPMSAVRQLCRGVVGPRFWRELANLFVSGDSKRWLYGAALGDEKPRWLTSFWDAYPSCYYGWGHQPGKTRVSC